MIADDEVGKAIDAFSEALDKPDDGVQLKKL